MCSSVTTTFVCALLLWSEQGACFDEQNGGVIVSGERDFTFGGQGVASGGRRTTSDGRSVIPGDSGAISGSNGVTSGGRRFTSGDRGARSGGRRTPAGDYDFNPGNNGVSFGNNGVSSGSNSVSSGKNGGASGSNGGASGNNGGASGGQNLSGLGRLSIVYQWKQITYNINGQSLLQDRFGEVGDESESRKFQDRRDTNERNGDRVVFRDNATGSDADFQSRIPDSLKYFIQYNNVPMGVERWKNKLFITMPRRRYGIPSTLNYLDLTTDSGPSPPLRPYAPAAPLVSVYRTRIDSCDRLWAVDTGLLEIPDARRQVRPPSIVVFDLKKDKLIHRYQLPDSVLINERTPAGLASITLDEDPTDCSNVYAYIVDLATYGIIVYSMKANDSWRVNHNFFSFDPLVGRMSIAGQQFSWNDGIFSIALGERDQSGFRKAYFHPMVSLNEFSVSTRVLRNRTLATRDDHGDDFKKEGSRGENSQSTMHGHHNPTGAMLYAEVGRDAIGCWNTRQALNAGSKATLAQDSERLIYPSDLHITGDEVWVMANTMPRFIYANLSTSEYNFRIFRGNVREMIAGTVCDGQSKQFNN